jgi:hypothetical protein
MSSDASTLIAAFVAASNAPDATPESTFLTLLQALYQERYTGAVTLHFQRGTPREAEFPQPVRVRFLPTGS